MTYSCAMGRMLASIAGIVLAVWLAFVAIGWVFAMVKTFLVVGLLAAAVVFVVSMLAKRRDRA